MIGQSIAHYKVTAKLGAGGMGEVYRATDSRLGRDVALKVLPEAFAADAQRMQRFQREAQLLASLNHPNIAAIYGLEETSTVRALAMELVEGQTLAERIAQGAIPVEEALPLARQIAEGLEYAHERSVIHRDLKPANIKLTPDGKVKILDFGLAKALSGDTAVTDISSSPTLSMAATQAGMILGTAAYMSPEQARGKPTDRRADIWAFGVVLFEMLSGRRMFAGETATDILAAVVRAEPDWTALPPEVPQRIRKLLERCLVKDDKRRLRDVGDARLEIEDAATGADEALEAAASEIPARRAPGTRFLVSAFAIAALVLGASLAWILKPAPAPPPVIRIAQTLPAGTIFNSVTLPIQNLVAISPDGTKVVVATTRGLLLRSFDSPQPALIPETLGASEPIFSPDGRWIGFLQGGQLKKMPVAGGAPTTIGPVIGITGGLTWVEDNSILMGGAFAGILQFSPDGGSPKLLVEPKPGIYYAQPRALPDGKTILYVQGVVSRAGTTQTAEVVIQTIGKDDPAVVLRGVRGGAYYSGGKLIYLQESGLAALSFDPAARKTQGEPVALAQHPPVSTGMAISHYAVSNTGTLVYVEMQSSVFRSRLVHVELSGKVSVLPTEVRGYSDPRVSPDGRMVAVHVQTEQDDVWVANTELGMISRLSFDPGEDETPVWSPDGRWLAWAASRQGIARGIFRRAADGSGAEELLWKTENHTHLRDWLADGKTMVVEIFDPTTMMDIWRLDLGEKVTATAFLKTPFNERTSRVSPDGRWIAYTSDESGRDEVYVQSFPQPGTKLQVSVGGGSEPVWSRDGRSIYFRGEGAVQMVSFQGTPAPSVGKPHPLFADKFESPQAGGHTGYDSRPGGGLLMIQSAEPQGEANAAGAQLVFVFNLLKN